MGEQERLLADAMPIGTAAKAVKMRRERFEELCREAGILIPWGGTKEHPRFKVRLSEAERAILNQKKVADSRAFVRPSGIHPQVRF